MSVRKNTIYLTGASIIQKAFSFVYFLVLAHFYGASSIGQYTYAIALTTIFAIVVDGGLTPVLIRSVAQDARGALARMKQVLLIKIFLLLVTSIGIASTILILDQAFEVRWLIVAAALVMVLDSVNLTLYGTLRGFHNVAYESAGLIIAQIISFGIGLFAAFQHHSIIVPILGLGLGSLTHLCVALYGLRRSRAKAAGEGQVTLGAPHTMVREAVPFALAGIFARGYSFLDTIILGSISFTASGLYSVPNKLTYAFQFIPLALSASLYPAFSKTLSTDKAEAAERWHMSQRYLLVVVFFIVSSVIALSSKLLGFYGDEFTVAETTLIILSISLIFSFVSFPVGALLNAAGLQRLQTTAMGFTLAVNAALNFLLIPQFGPVGAALSAVAGNCMLFGLGSWFAHRRVMPLPWRKLLQDVWKIALLGVLNGALLHVLVAFVPWYVAGVVGAVVYAPLLLAIGMIDRAELEPVLKKFRRV